MDTVKEELKCCDFCYTKDGNREFYPCTRPKHLVTIKPLSCYSICELCLKEQYDEKEREKNRHSNR